MRARGSSGPDEIRAPFTYDRDTVYSNLWVIRLDESGRRARSYTEWWMDQANPS